MTLQGGEEVSTRPFSEIQELQITYVIDRELLNLESDFGHNHREWAVLSSPLRTTSFPLFLHSPLATMESVVPPEIITELTQILSNLVLGDNEIRSK